MSVFEIIMLLCFGAAWPVSVKKSFTSRSNKGKSLVFLIVVELGYVAGIMHKVLYSRDLVIILYFVNLVMILVDIIIYFRNRRIAMHAEEVSRQVRA